MYDLTASVHKGTAASACIGHNNRSIAVPHCDKERTHLNIVYRDIPIQKAYRILFDEALLVEYNKGKKPSRQIKDYYEHIRKQFEAGEKKLDEARAGGASKKELAKIRSTYPKPFYELIVSVGNRDAYNGIFRNGGEKEDLCVATLQEYIADFEKRNPNLYVFGAYLHRDEPSSCPHLHIDYIPWSDLEQTRGLSKRVSENGAFKQQGLCSGEKGDIGTIAFQEQERRILTEVALKHDINIIDGSHSHRHLDKEEYALVTEKEKVSTAASKVNAGMRQLVQSQDDFKEFLKKNKDGRLFSEVQSLKVQSEKYSDMLTADSKRLAEYWSEYRSASSEFFAEYRQKKNELWSEIASARKESRANEKKIQSLLDSILYDSDLLIIKLIKLMSLLCHLIKGTALDAEITALQEANAAVKAEAKKVMALSNGIASELRSKEHTALQKTLTEYEDQLVHSMESIENTIRLNLDLQR